MIVSREQVKAIEYVQNKPKTLKISLSWCGRGFILKEKKKKNFQWEFPKKHKWYEEFSITL